MNVSALPGRVAVVDGEVKGLVVWTIAEQMLTDKGGRLLARLFTDAEAAYAMERARPALHLAARLAAKEAALKAIGTGRGTFTPTMPTWM